MVRTALTRREETRSSWLSYAQSLAGSTERAMALEIRLAEVLGQCRELQRRNERGYRSPGSKRIPDGAAWVTKSDSKRG
jgi:hypothetical protein